MLGPAKVPSPVRLRAHACRAVLALALLAGSPAGPGTARAAFAASAAPEPLVLVSPTLPDSWHGWRRTPTSISVLGSAGVLYRWDSDLGPWRSVTGPIVAPEGRHVLHLARVGGGIAAQPFAQSLWERDVALKVSFSSPPMTDVAPAEVLPAAAGSSASQSVIVRITVPPSAGPQLVRIGGRDRYATAALVSKANFATASTVILATGENFADALSSAALAGSYRGPLLLTRRDSLPSETLAEMRRLGAKKCVISGGTAAVSAKVASAVAAAGISVQRFGGRDRYETSALLAAEVGRREGARTLAFVARGDDFPDALAVSPFSYTGRAPILLVRPTSLPPATEDALARGGFGTAVIAGGTAAVSSGVESRIREFATTVTRSGGRDRYETAVRAADSGRRLGLTNMRVIAIATGQNFPDALCGGVAAGSKGGAVLLTKRDDLPTVTGKAIGDYGTSLRLVYVFGGTAAVGERVAEALRIIMQ